MLRFLKLLFAGTLATNAAAAKLQLDATPDLPPPFGYKVMWLAVKADDSAAVVQTLALPVEGPANWNTGLAAAMTHTQGQEPAHAFVAPAVRGWVLVVSASLPYPEARSESKPDGIGARFRTLQQRLASRFSEVQFFGSHRVVDFVAWSQWKRSAPERTFAYADGGTLQNIGVQSVEEARLGFADVSGLAPVAATQRLTELSERRDAAIQAKRLEGGRDAAVREREARRQPIPNEEDVLELAALWSLNPMQLPAGAAPGTGVVVRLQKAR